MSTSNIRKAIPDIIQCYTAEGFVGDNYYFQQDQSVQQIIKEIGLQLENIFAQRVVCASLKLKGIDLFQTFALKI